MTRPDAKGPRPKGSRVSGAGVPLNERIALTRDLRALADGTFDLLIAGGGIRLRQRKRGELLTLVARFLDRPYHDGVWPRYDLRSVGL